jgi:hypothetical protein
MDSIEMSKAIRDRAQKLRDADIDNPPTVGELNDDAELLRVLARIVEGAGIERAFGSPGDWGYSHPIGRALAARAS